jgi:hypothetical protein
MNQFHSVEIDGEEEGEHNIPWASHNETKDINNHEVCVRRNGLKQITYDSFFSYIVFSFD